MEAEHNHGSAEAVFAVDGMTCQNCARHVREAAERAPGVALAKVDLDAGRLTVRFKGGTPVESKAVISAVEEAGYGARVLEGEGCCHGTSTAKPGQGWRLNVILGGAVTLFLMAAEWGFGWHHRDWYPWLALALATPVQALCGWRFYRGAWTQLRKGQTNMDTLVALGSSAAFLYSVWVVFSGAAGHVYFMEAAAIITLISAGHWMEALATHRAANAIRALMNLAPDTARRIEADGAERVVPTSEVRVGDRIAVQPGDRVPVDAEVLEGASAVEESMLTGESRPVEKGPGAALFGGTLNADGRLVARVTATGEATLLARIVAAVERAQNSRADIQRLADKVSSVFVPIVVALALLTALAWGFAPDSMRAVHQALGRWLWTATLPETPFAAAVIHATAVLIIACPCAMGLATPAAIMAGTNAAALRGILIRDGIALEKAGRVDTLVFDKTGTLTEGRLTVRAARVADGAALSEAELRRLGAELARGSSHPVARAIAEANGDAPKNGANGNGAWDRWRELRGRGIEAERGGEAHRLGSPAWLRELGVHGAPADETNGAERAESPISVVGLAVGERYLGRFELEDALRSDAREVISDLKRQGFEVYLISGDARPAVEAVAREAGIDPARALAGVRAERKPEEVERLQKEGRRVAFVGDGINDGPALAQANLGIAVGHATDVARESADVVLVERGLGALREALGLSQATLRTIRQNLFWAFFYNAVGVPLAMLGFFSPILCAAAMGLSDLVVIGNAMRLRYWRGGKVRSGTARP